MLLPSSHPQETPSVFNHQTHFLFWARNAIYHGLKALRITRDDNVLVPSFHCTSVVEPILKYGAEVKFYEINADLLPDMADITRKIDNKTRAILAIHYFGFPQPLSFLKNLCRQQGLYLIEDCAHVLMGAGEDGRPLGSLGDISIFSWRKFLPTYDGGQLVINNPDLEIEIPLNTGGLVFQLKVTKNVVDKLIGDSGNRMCRLLAGLSRVPSLIARKLARTNGQSVTALSVNSYDLDFDVGAANLKMSSLSKYIVQNSDIPEIVAKRRANYNQVLEALKALPGVSPLYPSLSENVCPWVFPLLVHEIKDFHLILRASGVPAFTWSGVIHPSLPLNQFPQSKFLYDNLVFLPIHQSLNSKQMDTMIQVLQDELKAFSRLIDRWSAGATALQPS
jgi:dTDP-4-amino-4,6-dideoxygalactose transaminase